MAGGLTPSVAAEFRALYRGILRLHRHKLPPVMRALGDRVASEEFKVRRAAPRCRSAALRRCTAAPRCAAPSPPASSARAPTCDAPLTTRRQAIATSSKATEAHWRDFGEQWRLYTRTLQGQVRAGRSFKLRRNNRSANTGLSSPLSRWPPSARRWMALTQCPTTGRTTGCGSCHPSSGSSWSGFASRRRPCGAASLTAERQGGCLS